MNSGDSIRNKYDMQNYSHKFLANLSRMAIFTGEKLLGGKERLRNAWVITLPITLVANPSFCSIENIRRNSSSSFIHRSYYKFDNI